jgi:hypothetical protein
MGHRMSWPEIPTDNLYKFMAISGIVIIVCAQIPSYHAINLNVESIRLSGEQQVLTAEQDATDLLIRQATPLCLRLLKRVEDNAAKAKALRAEVEGLDKGVRSPRDAVVLNWQEPNSLAKGTDEIERKLEVLIEKGGLAEADYNDLSLRVAAISKLHLQNRTTLARLTAKVEEQEIPITHNHD